MTVFVANFTAFRQSATTAVACFVRAVEGVYNLAGKALGAIAGPGDVGGSKLGELVEVFAEFMSTVGVCRRGPF